MILGVSAWTDKMFAHSRTETFTIGLLQESMQPLKGYWLFFSLFFQLVAFDIFPFWRQPSSGLTHSSLCKKFYWKNASARTAGSFTAQSMEQESTLPFFTYCAPSVSSCKEAKAETSGVIITWISRSTTGNWRSAEIDLMGWVVPECKETSSYSRCIIEFQLIRNHSCVSCCYVGGTAPDTCRCPSRVLEARFNFVWETFCEEGKTAASAWLKKCLSKGYAY